MKKLTLCLFSLLMILSVVPVDAYNGESATNLFTVSNNQLVRYNTEEMDVIRQTNKERIAKGLAPVSTFLKLQNVAGKRAAELEDLFDHTRPNGKRCFTALDDYSVKYSSAGENIAAGYTTVDAVMNGWMNSAGHRANILTSSYDHLGVGLESLTNGYRYGWAQMFVGGCTMSKFTVQSGSAMVGAKGKSIEDLEIMARVYCPSHGYSFIPVISEMCTGYNANSGSTQYVTIKCGSLKTSLTVYRTSTSYKTPISQATVSSISNKTYSGRKIIPSFTVKYNGKTLKNGSDYTATYGANKSTGRGSVTITGKGKYDGTVTKYFYIVPKKVTISSLKSTSNKKLTVKYKKQTGASGYQIAYRKKGTSSWKYIYVSSNTASKTISGLSRKKYYQVKVRAYKTYNGTKYFGTYSATKQVKVK